jgi:predicted DsbA family dithiol-disulfide isomerase
MKLTVDLISDFVCPWCFVGEARLRAASALLAQERPEVQLEVRWLPYFLDPAMPPGGVPYQAYVEAKFGSAEGVRAMQARVTEVAAESGVSIDFAAISVRPSPLKAHRLMLRMQEDGVPADAVGALGRAIFSAHFQHGCDTGDTAELVALADSVDLSDDGLADWLEGDEAASEVMGRYASALRIGAEGVPFFVFDRRLAMSGAQPPELLLSAMHEALEGKG